MRASSSAIKTSAPPRSARAPPRDRPPSRGRTASTAWSHLLPAPSAATPPSPTTAGKVKAPPPRPRPRACLCSRGRHVEHVIGDLERQPHRIAVHLRADERLRATASREHAHAARGPDEGPHSRHAHQIVQLRGRSFRPYRAPARPPCPQPLAATASFPTAPSTHRLRPVGEQRERPVSSLPSPARMAIACHTPRLVGRPRRKSSSSIAGRSVMHQSEYVWMNPARTPHPDRGDTSVARATVSAKARHSTGRSRLLCHQRVAHRLPPTEAEPRSSRALRALEQQRFHPRLLSPQEGIQVEVAKRRCLLRRMGN